MEYKSARFKNSPHPKAEITLVNAINCGTQLMYIVIC